MIGSRLESCQDAGRAITAADALSLVILLALAFIVRFYRLFDLDVWFDEVAILFQIEKTYAENWQFCAQGTFPPLYPWLAKLWHGILPGADSLRLFSAWQGALVPPVAYLLGKELGNKKLGWLLGLSCVFSVPLIYYSQVIRMYSLFVLFACISLWGFIRGVRTNKWHYWALTALANLLGFYTFLFMVFVILSELILLFWFFRFELSRYFRPVGAHLPALILISLWIVPLLQGYQVEQSYAIKGTLKINLFYMGFYLGTGVTFRNHFILAAFINIPLWLGFLFSVSNWFKRPAQLILAATFVITILAVLIISLSGNTIFEYRYLTMLVPVYWGLVLLGWNSKRSIHWRRAGLSLVFTTMLISVVYYYSDYLAVHDFFRYHGAFRSAADDDGRSISRTADLLQKQMEKGEVIIHYSAPSQRNFTFFSSLYYHQRTLPEYLYARAALAPHCGQRAALPGEVIHSLRDIKPLPRGVWVVTLSPPEILLGSRPSASINRHHRETWIERENLPEELRQLGYRCDKTIQDGSVAIVHFRHEKTG